MEQQAGPALRACRPYRPRRLRSSRFGICSAADAILTDAFNKTMADGDEIGRNRSAIISIWVDTGPVPPQKLQIRSTHSHMRL